MSDVLDEHFEYMSLRGRSQRFRDAISKVVKPGDVVVDVGCGFGVLGIFCLQAGAARVYGIDHSDAIEIARESATRAGLGDRYHCIRGSTFHAQLPEQADVVICDHVGFFGFDYGIIEMLADARKRFLKPGGTVIPGKLQLKLAGAASEAASEKANRWTLETIPDEFHWLHDYGLNSKHTHSFSAQDICTPAAQLGAIDLNADASDSYSFKTSIEAERDCEIDGLAGWFEAELAAGVCMTNSPLDPRGIERPQIFLACREPVALKAGETLDVSIRLRHDSNMIAWSISPPAPAARQKLSTWNSLILKPEDLMVQSDEPLTLNQHGNARKVVTGFVDGTRSAAEIEETVLSQHPDLLPSPQAIRRFVRAELGRSAQ